MPAFILFIVFTFLLCISTPASAIQKPLPTPDPNPYTGEPREFINPYDGSFQTSCKDISIGSLGLEFTRFYSSLSAANELMGSKRAGNAGNMGAGWATNFDFEAVTAPENPKNKKSGRTGFILKFPDGKECLFIQAKNPAPPDRDWYVTRGKSWKAAVKGGITAVYIENRVYVFDSSGKLTGIKDRAGKGVTVSYAGATTTAEDNYGRKLFIVRNDEGLIVSAASNMPGMGGCKYNYEKNSGLNFLITADRPGLEDAQYGYGGDAAPAGFISYIGDFRSEGREKEIILKAEKSKTGARYTGAIYGGGILCNIDYKDGKSVEVTDSHAARTYQFYPGGAVKNISYAGGAADQMEYDADGRIKRRVFNAGFTEEYLWDKNGFLKEKKTKWMDPVVGSGNKTEHFTFDKYGCLLIATGGSVGSEARTYDEEGRLLSVTRGSCATVYRYNEAGLIEVEKDGEKAFRKFEYDGSGNIVKITSGPERYEVCYSYDGSGRLAAYTEIDGVRMQYFYSVDFPSKPESITMDGQDAAKFSYDSRGNLISLIDDYGAVSYFYTGDALTAEKDRAGLQKNYRYDKYGKLTEADDTAGRIRKYRYDRRGLISEIYDTFNRVFSYAYDSAGNTENIKDRNGNTAYYGYDGLGRLRSIITPAGTVSVFEYDDSGNKTAVIYGKRSAVTFSYDANSRLVRESYADGSHTDYGYSPEGDLLTISVYDRRGDRKKQQVLKYDGSHRLVDDGFCSYDYGGAGFPGAGMVTGVRNNLAYSGGGYVRYAYDKKGRMTIRDEIETLTDEKAHKRTVRIGGDTLYDVYFDGQGRSTEIIERSGGSNSVFTIQRDPAGRIMRIIYPNGNETSLDYDAEGRTLTCVNLYKGPESKAISQKEWLDYDYEGNRIVDNSNSALAYNYDVDYRLKYASGATWSYDKQGNRVTSSEAGTGGNVYSADDMGRYAYAGGNECEYDAAGNLTNYWGTWGGLDEINYVKYFTGYNGMFDNNERLIKEIIGTAYDSRKAATGSGGTSYSGLYISDGEWFFGLVEKNGADYKRSYFMPDSRGSVSVVCGMDGKYSASYGYSPFGINTSVNDGDTNTLQFAGMSGAHSAGSRTYTMRGTYDAVTGRLISRDKNNIMQGKNFYEYNGDNPFNRAGFEPFIGGIGSPADAGEKEYLKVPPLPSVF